MSRFIAFFFFIILFPLYIFISLLIVLDSNVPLFLQKRLGKNKRAFIIYKFRTMRINTEQEKEKLYPQNEVDGPVFKIYNDPRFTKIGAFLSHTGLDELPQLINIIKGEMDFVGPRPLPIDEALQVPKQYDERFSVLPGITSPWVVNGSHNMTFQKWMESDREYVKRKSFWYDLSIMGRTILLFFNICLRLFKK